MFSTLQKRWGVGKKDALLILCVFALTGFTTAWLSRSITGWLGLDASSHWAARWSVRLAVLVFGYQVVLLTFAFLLGQFSFFWKFEKKILQRLRVIKAKSPRSSKPNTSVNGKQPVNLGPIEN